MPTYVYRLVDPTPGDLLAASGIEPDSVSLVHVEPILDTVVAYLREVRVTRAAAVSAAERAGWDAFFVSRGYVYNRTE